MISIEILQTQKRELERRIVSIDAEIREANLEILEKRFSLSSDTKIDVEFLEKNLPDIINKIKAEAVREALKKYSYEHPYGSGVDHVDTDDLYDYANKLEAGEI